MLPTGTHAGRPARGDPSHPSLPFLLSAHSPPRLVAVTFD